MTVLHSSYVQPSLNLEMIYLAMQAHCQVTSRRHRIKERPRELQKSVHIFEVGHEAYRDAEGARSRDADVSQEIIPLLPLAVRSLVLPCALKRLEKRLFLQIEGSLTGARVAETSRAQGQIDLVSTLLNYALVNHVTVCVDIVECNCSAAHIYVCRTIEPDQWEPRLMAEREHLFEEPVGQAHDAKMDSIPADVLELTEADVNGWKVQEVDCAIFKALVVVKEDVAVAQGRASPDGSTSERWTLQFQQGILAGNETPDTGWVTEHLVERYWYEVGVPYREVEAVSRYIGGGIETDEATLSLGSSDPFEWVLNTAEVGLSGVGEESRTDRAIKLGFKSFLQGNIAHTEIGCQWDIGSFGAFCACELADTLNGVVVVHQQDVVAPGVEWECLSDKLQRARCVGSENHAVLLRRRLEILEDTGTGILVQLCHGA